ncbi:MAG TPA: AMP-binding protein [Bacteroidales bacterium]|nr:AMP-binding protein [Bacteroidales bacterium]
MLRFTVEAHPSRPALSWEDGTPLPYARVLDMVHALASRLGTLGIEAGDRVAILGHNMPSWGIANFGIHCARAVMVPLLPDFHAREIANILKHSGSKAVILSDSLRARMEEMEEPFTGIIIRMDDLDQQEAVTAFEAVDVQPGDLAAIIYTSGTTGSSKGVMLTHRNICTNVYQGYALQQVVKEDRFLSLLPLSHTLENTLSLLLPVSQGACVYYLRKPPTPAVLLPALQRVKPTTILSVPLIIEKIYRNKVLPTFTRSAFIRFLYTRTAFRRVLHWLAGKSLMRTFGGEVRFFGIGGAKLAADVERFLLEARFPYAIGYGLTECAPLLAGKVVGAGSFQSTGKPVPEVELRIHEPDPVTGEGEIWVKGPNVMQGYYREPALTEQVLTPDGWFRTGDLGVFNGQGDLVIKGRSKSMIVGSSGENIYPEEIESVINTFRYVVESVVIEQKGKLVAMVHFNREALEEKYKHLKEEVSDYVEHRIDELRKELHDYVNSRVNKFSRVHSIHHHPTPFQKTATHKIKRFLYPGEKAEH